MSTLVLDDPALSETAPDTAAEQLRSTMAAARLSFTWLGVRKTLTPAQKNQAADSFGAEGKYLSAGKKLLDTSHPAFKRVTSLRGRVLAYFKGVSLPYPEPGIRLIRQDRLGEFDQQLTAYREELERAVQDLDQRYSELRSAARRRLGVLFDPGDYPTTLIGMFGIDHDFPSVEPPSYLQHLNPELYQQECQRVQARFDEAVQLAEQAFLEELNRLVDHLTERLSGTVDGKFKVFRDSAVTHLEEFFTRFQALNIHSSEQLDQLVARAQRVLRGVEPQTLRESEPVRQRVRRQLSGVQSLLEGLLVDRPRRHILRKPR